MVAERLGHPVDVAGPRAAAAGAVVEAALVLGEPAGERALVQHGPHVDALGPGGAEHLGDERGEAVVPVAGPRLEAGPVDGPPQRAHPGRGEQGEVGAEVLAEPVAAGGGGQAALGLPSAPVAAGRHAERSGGGGGDAPANALFNGHIGSIPGTVPPWGRPIATGTPGGTARRSASTSTPPTSSARSPTTCSTTATSTRPCAG